MAEIMDKYDVVGNETMSEDEQVRETLRVVNKLDPESIDDNDAACILILGMMVLNLEGLSREEIIETYLIGNERSDETMETLNFFYDAMMRTEGTIRAHIKLVMDILLEE